LEKRISAIEEGLKSANTKLKEQQQDNSSAMSLREQAHRMYAELEEFRRSRKACEERAGRLQALLLEERQDRKAWLADFMTSLQSTLDELNSNIDRSIEERGHMMLGSLDEADGMLGKLMKRVDLILSTREMGNGTDQRPPEQPRPSVGSAKLAGTPAVPGSPTRLPSAAFKQPAALSASSMETARVASVQTGRSAASTSSLGDSERRFSPSPVATTAAPGPQILQSWQSLLNENIMLHQRRSELVSQRQRQSIGHSSRGSSEGGSTSPCSPPVWSRAAASLPMVKEQP